MWQESGVLVFLGQIIPIDLNPNYPDGGFLFLSGLSEMINNCG